MENDLQEQRRMLQAAEAELKKLRSSEVNSDPLGVSFIISSFCQPPLVELERANTTLVRDREKFLAILKRYESRKEKFKEAIAYEKAELITLGILKPSKH